VTLARCVWVNIGRGRPERNRPDFTSNFFHADSDGVGRAGVPVLAPKDAVAAKLSIRLEKLEMWRRAMGARAVS
jgi:hypothetical protein